MRPAVSLNALTAAKYNCGPTLILATPNLTKSLVVNAPGIGSPSGPATLTETLTLPPNSPTTNFISSSVCNLPGGHKIYTVVAPASRYLFPFSTDSSNVPPLKYESDLAFTTKSSTP